MLKTDGDIIKLMRKLDACQARMLDLFNELEDSLHPNTELIRERLSDNDYPVLAWATHVVHDCLEHPENWETGYHGIRRVRKQNGKA